MFKNLFKKAQGFVEDEQPEKRGYDEEEGAL